MDTSLNISDIDRLIKKEEKRYGTALGRLIKNGIGDTKGISELTAINASYNALIELQNKVSALAVPAPVQKNTSLVSIPAMNAEPEEDDEYMPPEGICSSEDCEDEFCLEYWKKVEGNS